MLTILLAAGLLALATGQNETAKMQLLQNTAGYFEGNFCYTPKQTVVGYEIVVHLEPGASSVKSWDADIGYEGDKSGGCIKTVTLVSKEYKGVYPAGANLCVKLAGTPCGLGSLSGTGTLVNLGLDKFQVPAVPAVAGAQETKYNYGEVLQKSLLFYEAQRSGKLPPDNRIPWRFDSALGDKGLNGEDLTGGLYDAGDNVKFNFPMAWTATVLEWSYLLWADAYQKTGQEKYLISTIRWILDYLLKCHTKPDELYVQVGDGGIDHGQWTRPENLTGARPSFKIDAAHPGSDIAGEVAAAFAAGSIIFKTTDPAYSAKLLTHAKQLYEFAEKYTGKYSASVQAAAAYYQSAAYLDELGWGAAWLYKATGDKTYLTKAEAQREPGKAWGFSWDEKTGGLHTLLYEATKDDKYKQDIIATYNSWLPGGDIPYSPKCLAFRLQWGALRYSSNVAFLALVNAQLGINPEKYRKFALSQINYALGDTGRSFVVGFGVNPPVKPHHRASSCPLIPAPCNWEEQSNPGPNPHTLYGALVGGPGQKDDYEDKRDDYIHNEVACDYNAGFTAAVAGLEHLAIAHQLPATYKDICPSS